MNSKVMKSSNWSSLIGIQPRMAAFWGGHFWWGVLYGHGFGRVIEGNECSELSSNTVIFQGLGINEGLNGEIIEELDMVWEDIHNKIVETLIFPL